MALTPAMLFPAVIKTDSTEDGNHVILVAKNTAGTPVNMAFRQQDIPELVELLIAAGSAASEKRKARFGSSAAADLALGMRAPGVKSFDVAQSPSEGGNTILVSARLNNGLSYNLALSTETARTLADKVNDALENPAKISQQ